MTEFFKKFASNLVLVLALGLIVSIISHSCRGKETPPKAEITILDTTGTAVADAQVILYCVQRPDVPTECNVADTQTTDGVGKVEFEFENPSVLRVSVEKYNTIERDTGIAPNFGTVIIGDTLCAEGFITLETNEVTEETYVVSRCQN